MRKVQVQVWCSGQTGVRPCLAHFWPAVSGGRVLHSVLSPGVRVNSYCEVEYSILMPGVEIGRYSRVRRAILNTGVKLPELHSIGFDADADRASGYTVTEGGVTVVGD